MKFQRLLSSLSGVSAFAVAAAFASSTASGTVYTADYRLTGPTLFSAAPGTTNVYSGLISGTGPAIVEGGGTVAFSYVGNAYTGGTIVSNAVFRLDADGCAGLGAITAAVSKAHIYMNCANVPNDLYFAAGYNANSQPTSAKLGDYPAAQTVPLFPLVSSVTVGGKVYFKENSQYLPGSSKMPFSATVTFEKDVETAQGKVLKVYSYGTTVFNGRLNERVSNSLCAIGGADSAQGNVVFNSSSNSVYMMSTYNAKIALNAPDALANSSIYFRYGKQNYGCIFDLDGNDQSIGEIIWCHDGSSKPATAQNDNGYRFRTTSGKPATLRITGHTYVPNGESAPYKNKVALSGPLTLVMDVGSSAASGFYQEFSLRTSSTSGDLVISKGDFRVTDGATFPNVPRIFVGERGSFSSAGTTSAFVGCKSLEVDGTMTFANDVVTPFAEGAMALSLGSSARLTLPSGYTATVASLKVGGDFMPDGIYGDGGTAVDQILVGTVVVRSHDRYVDCVTGNDSNDGSEAHPYKTIRAATSNAVSGDVIHVAPGTYGAAEGAEKFESSANSLCRVIIPEDVTIESTEGAERTFIVGAPASGGDANAQGNGSGAVRCVYAKNGACLRGFTLTGGHTEKTASSSTSSYDKYGAAFLAPSDKWAYIEDCVVSNNYSHYATLYRSTVRRCRILNNIGGTQSGTGADAAAGSGCIYISSIIAGNRGNATLAFPTRIESCTFGKNLMHNDGSAQVLYNNSSGGKVRVLNSLFTYASDRFQGTVYATNCIFRCEEKTNLSAENCSNCLFGTSVSLTNYKPNPGSKVIDAGDNGLASDELEGAKDIFGTPRALNGAIDIGAVEYDWRPTFSRKAGKSVSITYASPSVTTNAADGLLVPSGAVAGTLPAAGLYDFTFTLPSGSLEAFVGGVSAGVYSGAGERTIKLAVPDSATEFRLVYTPDPENPEAALLRRVASSRKFLVIVR